MRKANYFLLGLLISAALLMVGCSDESEAANKLVDEGNALIKKNEELAAKAMTAAQSLPTMNEDAMEDLDKFKADSQKKFDELATMYTEFEKNYNDASSKFDQASKLKVDEKFKEYTSVKAQELKKRAEIGKVSAAYFKTGMSGEPDKAAAAGADFTKKVSDLTKEADDLSKKADKITKDNPSVFKTN